MNSKFRNLEYVFLLFAGLHLSLGQHSVGEFPCGHPPPFSPLYNESGVPAGVRAPWNAILIIRDEIMRDQTYAGILVSPSLVLLSARYFYEPWTTKFHFHPIQNHLVSLGTEIFGDPSGIDENPTLVNITQIRIHPLYQSGPWPVRRYNYALVHLQQEIPITDKVQPICIPDWRNGSELIEQLIEPSRDPEEEEFLITGWNRQLTSSDISLRMKIQNETACRKIWEDHADELGDFDYDNGGTRWCALIGKKNLHKICVHKDIGTTREMNGTFFMNGIVDNLYTQDKSRICYADTPFFIRKLDVPVSKWIEDNMKCGPDKFTCSSGDCIPLPMVCDRKLDCPDGSDEERNFCRGQNFCGEGMFECGVYGRCILETEKCDGARDCEDGEDEMDCPIDERTIVAIIVGTATLIGFIFIPMLIYLRRRVHRLKREIRSLTDDEVKQFLNGRKSSKTGTFEAVNTQKNKEVSDFDAIPWNTKYEIPLDAITEGEEIDRGNFGIVRLVKLRVDTENGKHVFIEAAAKNPLRAVTVTDFKAFLREIKMLAYVGDHPHVVQFFGASLEDIRNRKVSAIVEYCRYGNLKDFLCSRAPYFKDLNSTEVSILDSLLDQDYCEPSVFLDTADLVLWASQIAQGMEHIASKRIIHGDLAARNVLLSSKNVAKISDFGLAKRCTGVYSAKSPIQVPWKWLAPEALQHQRFSEKSDVWSFGITLYEIFALGLDPYENIPVYNEGFAQDLLESGVRPTRPKYACDAMFNVICECLRPEAARRPNFTALAENLISILSRYLGEAKRESADSGIGNTSLSTDVEVEYAELEVQHSSC